MTPDLPPEISPEELEGWLDSLGRATGLDLVFGPPGGTGALVEANGEVLGTLRAEGSPAGEERVAEAARLLSRLADDRVARRDLVAQMARLWKEQNFLTGVATSLALHATPEETAVYLLSRIVRLLAVERASILLVRDDGRLVVTAAQGLGANSQVGALIPDGGVADRVFKSGEPILVENIDRLGADDAISRALHGEARTKSFLSVPIVSNGVPIGVINVTDRVASKPFHAEDRKLIAAIAAQAGIAFANVKLLEEARRAEALTREVDLASRIQRSLLPKGPFDVPGFDVYGRCEPAALVGGDSFEIAARPGGGLWAAVFDVSGHGMSAALLMASARAALKALVTADLTPAEAARALNALVAADVGDTGMYLTACLLRADADGAVRICSVGHPSPFLLRRDGGLRVFEAGGPPAGVVEEARYGEDETRLAPGEALLLYTDGLSGADGGAGEVGEELLKEWFAARRGFGAEEAAEGLFGEVYRHLGGSPIGDDVTVLVVRRATEGA